MSPPEPKEEILSPAGEGVGGPNSNYRRKILALCLFCETCFLSQLRLKHLGGDRKQCPEYINYKHAVFCDYSIMNLVLKISKQI
jgi:hypothetical protein